MPVSAGTLKMLMDAGLAGDALLAVVASIDADMGAATPATPARNLRQERNARYYDGNKERLKASEKRLNRTSYKKPPSPTPPTSNPTPLSPLKGTVPPFPESQSGDPAEKSIDDWVEGIWDATPTKARQRSSKRDLHRAMTAAVRRGQPPGAIADALRAYYASPDATKDGGEFAKGVHRLVQEDRWTAWSIGPTAMGLVDISTWSHERWAAAISRWRATGHWPTGVGPPPDDPATLVPSPLKSPPLLRVIA